MCTDIDLFSKLEYKCVYLSVVNSKRQGFSIIFPKHGYFFCISVLIFFQNIFPSSGNEINLKDQSNALSLLKNKPTNARNELAKNCYLPD
jgi:hypothetical protein